MLQRLRTLLIVPVIASLLMLSTGCKSSQLIKPRGFGWLGNKSHATSESDALDFPPPSSAEVPQSLSDRRAQVQAQLASATPDNTAAANAGMAGLAAAPIGSQGATSSPTADHPMVQNGFYGATGPGATLAQPASTAAGAVAGVQNPSSTVMPPAYPVTTAPNLGVPAVVAPEAIASPAMLPPVGAVTGTPGEVALANHQSAQCDLGGGVPACLAAPATHQQPVGPMYDAPTAMHASADLPLGVGMPTATAPTPSASGATGAFYQSQTQQPRPWRPGSTSDLITR